MPIVNITHTEINPMAAAGAGGGRKEVTNTEINPIGTAGAGGGRRTITLTELNPPLLEATVTTDPATQVGAVSATLNGTLDDEGLSPCDCGFEWGLDTNYGHFTSTEKKGTGETFAQTLTGLESNTTYHFRALATNPVGTSYGTDRSFRTKLIINKSYALGREEL